MTKCISKTQRRRNRAIATPRARVEHVFGALAQMGGKLVRCLGIVRTIFFLQLNAASYNLKRLVFLKERGLAPFKTHGLAACGCQTGLFTYASR